jgi:hypothetical protein
MAQPPKPSNPRKRTRAIAEDHVAPSQTAPAQSPQLNTPSSDHPDHSGEFVGGPDYHNGTAYNSGGNEMSLQADNIDFTRLRLRGDDSDDDGGDDGLDSDPDAPPPPPLYDNHEATEMSIEGWKTSELLLDEAWELDVHEASKSQLYCRMVL